MPLERRVFSLWAKIETILLLFALASCRLACCIKVALCMVYSGTELRPTAVNAVEGFIAFAVDL